MPELATTQRAYTLRMCGHSADDQTWRDTLWKTHVAVIRGSSWLRGSETSLRRTHGRSTCSRTSSPQSSSGWISFAATDLATPAQHTMTDTASGKERSRIGLMSSPNGVARSARRSMIASLRLAKFRPFLRTTSPVTISSTKLWLKTRRSLSGSSMVSRTLSVKGLRRGPRGRTQQAAI